MSQNTILNEIYDRRASRALKSDKIPRETINRLIKAATLAPSCFNKQPWRFIAADDPQTLGKVHEALTGANYWAKKAPVMIAVLTDVSLGCSLSDRRDYALFDTGFAVMNIMLQAEKEGLIAHPMAGFDPFKIKEIFKVCDSYIVITLIALGGKGGSTDHLNEKHLSSETSPRDRKPIDEVLSYNRWI
ncbi:MAG: nitroreductase family protein [Spirochaetia bacterium]|jgi:nitroreductase|nr:nitroreductase family protein [Spirochaetia bacterium]